MMIVASGVFDVQWLIIFQQLLLKLLQLMIDYPFMARPTSKSVGSITFGSQEAETYSSLIRRFANSTSVVLCHRLCKFLNNSVSISFRRLIGGPQSRTVSAGAGPI